MTDNGEHEALVAYTPVIHRGYVELFRRHQEADMYILDRDIQADFSHLRKDIRALEPEEAKGLVESLAIFRSVGLLGKAAIRGFEPNNLVMPDDDVSHELHAQYFEDKRVTYEPVFLRWDRRNSTVDVTVDPDREVEASDIGVGLIKLLYQEAEQSSDWWRRVGAALVSPDGKLIGSSHNRHLPTDYTPWIDNDPRSNAKRGQAIEISTVQHAEASLVSQAAREGVGTNGSEIYVSTFPCPPCAKLIAEAGIDTCYFVEGYAMGDGLRVLRDSGVEIVKVVTDADEEQVDPKLWVPYPKKS